MPVDSGIVPCFYFWRHNVVVPCSCSPRYHMFLIKMYSKQSSFSTAKTYWKAILKSSGQHRQPVQFVQESLPTCDAIHVCGNKSTRLTSPTPDLLVMLFTFVGTDPQGSSVQRQTYLWCYSRLWEQIYKAHRSNARPTCDAIHVCGNKSTRLISPTPVAMTTAIIFVATSSYVGWQSLHVKDSISETYRRTKMFLVIGFIQLYVVHCYISVTELFCENSCSKPLIIFARKFYYIYWARR